jgi:hypothetical protein
MARDAIGLTCTCRQISIWVSLKRTALYGCLPPYLHMCFYPVLYCMTY